MTGGITLADRETLLVERARDLLAAGPTDAQTLVRHVCQLPTMPAPVAEHMAIALLASHRHFARAADGLWWLADALAAQAPRAFSAVSAIPGSLDELSWAVVDVETTGGRAEAGDRITEIAVVVVEKGVVTRTFETLVNPERSIPPFITRLTNISWSMVKDAPTFRDVCDQVLEVLEGRIFVAHNASFDWRFVSSEIQRVTSRTLEGRRLCTVRLARRLLPQLRRRSLDSVALHYGVDIAARHRAGGDAEATAKVLLRLLADARQGHGCATWADLDRFLVSGSATAKRRRSRRAPALPQPVSRDTTA